MRILSCFLFEATQRPAKYESQSRSAFSTFNSLLTISLKTFKTEFRCLEAGAAGFVKSKRLGACCHSGGRSVRGRGGQEEGGKRGWHGGDGVLRSQTHPDSSKHRRPSAPRAATRQASQWYAIPMTMHGPTNGQCHTILSPSPDGMTRHEPVGTNGYRGPDCSARVDVCAPANKHVKKTSVPAQQEAEPGYRPLVGFDFLFLERAVDLGEDGFVQRHELSQAQVQPHIVLPFVDRFESRGSGGKEQDSRGSGREREGVGAGKARGEAMCGQQTARKR